MTPYALGPEAQYLLRVEDLAGGYGARQVLYGVTFGLSGASILSVIGHNGAGKSTLLKSIFGMVPDWGGRVLFEGGTATLAPRWWLKHGVAYVPQGNQVFCNLTVQENLQIAGATLADTRAQRKGFERVLAEFPVLRAKLKQRGGTLSGGEKQILALGMSLILEPRLLMLDEPSLGLAPPMARRVFEHIVQLNRNRGVAILIVEQKVRHVLAIADRVVVIRMGRVAFEGPARDLAIDEARLRAIYL